MPYTGACIMQPSVCHSRCTGAYTCMHAHMHVCMDGISSFIEQGVGSPGGLWAGCRNPIPPSPISGVVKLDNMFWKVFICLVLMGH